MHTQGLEPWTTARLLTPITTERGSPSCMFGEFFTYVLNYLYTNVL
jgi:hypothetical protein